MKIAESTGGRYFRAADDVGFQGAFTQIDSLEKTEMESRVRVLYTEKFAQALLPAGLLLGLELLLAGTRLRRIP
jgi:Ca-activated chloride channel family protein